MKKNIYITSNPPNICPTLLLEMDLPVEFSSDFINTSTS